MLIQFAFFGAYFVFSIPSAKIIDWIGYQRSMVVGLLTMGLGAFLFVPAASVPSYPLFLVALIVLAAGITCLQVAANPYVTVLGKAETASSRLNLTQAFNSLGTFLAPFFGGLLILSAAPKTMEEIRALAPGALQAYRLHEAATVKTPYVVLGIALVLAGDRHRQFQATEDPPRSAPDRRKGGRLHLEASESDLWRDCHFRVRRRGGFHRKLSGELLQPARDWRPDGKTCRQFRRLLLGRSHGRAFYRVRAAAEDEDRAVARHLRGDALPPSVTISMLTTGHFAMWSIILVGFFNSIMFPSIFTLGVAELGPLTGDGSGVMIMAIVGGALIPLAQGAIADRIGIHHAFFLPVICYLYILFFALSGSKPNSERQARA